MIKRRTLFGIARIAPLATATVAWAVGAAFLTPALGHEADCPFCRLKLVQGTKEQDNEVVLKFGNKKIEYRCIYCVFKDQKRYKGNIVVNAPSEKKGEPVLLKRADGKWSGPDGAVFLNTFKQHQECAAMSRAFTSKAGFDTYVKKHAIKGAKPLTLEEFIQSVAKS